MAYDSSDLDALISRARRARNPDDLRGRARAARLDADVLEELLFEVAVQSAIVQGRCDSVVLPPDVEAVLHQRLAREHRHGAEEHRR